MSTNTHRSGTENLRKTVIVALLVGLMVVLYRFGPVPEGFDTRGLLVFGFIVLASYTFGELVDVIKLPHITGYLLAGLLLGPSLWHMMSVISFVPLGPFEDGVLNAAIIKQLEPLDTLALALIALTAGGEIKVSSLRRDASSIFGMLSGQTALIMVLITGLIFLFSGVLPFASIPVLTTLSGAQVLAIGGLIAAVSVATSPAATIAVINGVGANKGELARLVLSTVVVKDVLVIVLFTLVGTYATSAFGLVGSGDVLLGLLWHVGGSLLIGAAIGAGMALYMRTVGVELIIFILVSIFTASYVATSVHLEPVLLFMASGFFAANFSGKCDDLLHSVERLSAPVYVLFFTLAGAKLHLDMLASMALFALALVIVRSGALAIGVRMGGRLSNTPDMVIKYGWMGFISQAGVAITLAGIIGTTYGKAGQMAQTLLIAAVAINEIIGPIALKVALGLAGEIPVNTPVDEEPAHSSQVDIQPMCPTETTTVTWPKLPTLEDNGLTNHLDSLQLGLQNAIQNTLGHQLIRARKIRLDLLRDLRRSFLRTHHQQLALSKVKETNQKALHRELVDGEIGLASKWRDCVSAYQIKAGDHECSPVVLLPEIDRIAEALPADLVVPLESASYESKPDESPFMSTMRGALKMRRMLSRWFGLAPATRAVALQATTRYHLAGRLPEDLESVAADLLNVDRFLAERIGAIFDLIKQGYEASDDVSPDSLWRLRVEVDEEFSLGQAEVNEAFDEALNRTFRIFSDHLRLLYDDLATIGTFELPNFSRRFFRVYKCRVNAVQRLDDGINTTKTIIKARSSLLALELEMASLKARLKAAIADKGDPFVRLLKGRGHRQVNRVTSALNEGLQALEVAFVDGEADPASLSSKIREITKPLEHIVADAANHTAELRDEITDEQLVSPLLQAVRASGAGVTSHYQIPTQPIQFGSRSLPPEPNLIEIPLRELVSGFLESKIATNVIDLTHNIGEEFEPAAVALRELERVVSFNIDLALAELATQEGESPSKESRGLAREMVIGALVRSLSKLEPIEANLSGCSARAEAGVRGAIFDDLNELTDQLVAANASEVWHKLKVATDKGIAEANALSRLLHNAYKPWFSLARRVMGKDTLEALGVTLGLPQKQPSKLLPTIAFRRHTGSRREDRLPAVYRRLFSDQALEAGDLLTGRSQEIDDAKAALSGSKLRAIAVVGGHGVGKGAVISAIVRGFDDKKVHRISLTKPISAAQIDAWFDPKRTEHVTIISGLHWLTVEIDATALSRFVTGVIADGGKNIWVVGANDAVWSYLCSFTHLAEAFPSTIHLNPLNREQLRDALLARHTLSGMSLVFDDSIDDLGVPLLARGSASSRESIWFNELHRTTGGIVQDALRAFLASIVEVDDPKGEVVIGKTPQSPDATLSRLDDDDLITIRQIMRQGVTSPKLHAAAFGENEGRAEAKLLKLAHWSILQSHGDFYTISEHLLGALHRVIGKRGWS